MRSGAFFVISVVLTFLSGSFSFCAIADTVTDEAMIEQYKNILIEQEDLESTTIDREDLDDQIAAMEDEISGLEEEFEELSAEFETVDPESDVEAYNSVVAQLNANRVSLSSDIQGLRDLLTERDEIAGVISQYIGRFLDFRRDFDQWYQGLSVRALSADEQEHYGQMREEIERIAAGIFEETIGFVDEGGGIVVPVTLAPSVKVNMLVDTGASLVVISEQIASLVDMEYVRGKDPITLTVADGRTIPAKFALLSCVTVGEASAVEVPVAVVDDASVAHPGGVLGMSFLRSFYFSIDAQNKCLVLRSYRGQ